MSEPAGKWSPPDPSTLPGLRTELAEQMRSPVERHHTAQMLLSGLGSVSPRTGDPARDAAEILGEEHDRLTAAELYFVTEDLLAPRESLGNLRSGANPEVRLHIRGL